MSDTRKTKPIRIRLLQEPDLRRVRHDHTTGPCDIDRFDFTVDRTWHSYRGSRFVRCRYEPIHDTSLYSNSNSRHRNELKVERKLQQGRVRAQERMAFRAALSASLADIEDFDLEPYRTRSGAKWNVE